MRAGDGDARLGPNGAVPRSVGNAGAYRRPGGADLSKKKKENKNYDPTNSIPPSPGDPYLEFERS